MLASQATEHELQLAASAQYVVELVQALCRVNLDWNV
jgi:hypothetical protein